jgi:hypothetical protein
MINAKIIGRMKPDTIVCLVGKYQVFLLKMLNVI